MRLVLLPVAGLLLTSSLGLQGPPPPARDAQPPKTGTASLSGRVVAADSGAPIRYVAVQLTSREGQVYRTAVTDGAGRYAFDELPAGRYQLSVVSWERRGAYLPTPGRNGRRGGDVFDLAEGQALENHDVPLPRAGAIVGRVLDEYGDPVSNVNVAALADRPGGPTRVTGGANRTDDQGAFRLFGLQPGDYFVKADDPGLGAMSATTEGWLPTYYPGTANLADAPVVHVDAGQDAGAIEIRLVRSRAFHIRGVVLDADGRPSPRAMVMITYAAEGGMRGSAGSANDDGTFEQRGLLPGEYELRASSPGEAPSSEPALASPTAHVTIVGADVEGLTLSMTRGVTVQGQIVTDDGAVPAFRPRLQIMVYDPASSPSGPPNQATVKEDWTFQLEHVRGPVVVRTMGPVAPHWRLKAVLHRGVDISERPTEFREPVTSRDLRLVVTNRGARVSGLVRRAGGRPAAGGMVLLLPAERDQHNVSALGFRTSAVGESGRYAIDLVQAGTYLLVAVEEPIAFGLQGDVRQLDALVRHATRLTILGDETKTVDLTVADLAK